MLDSLIQWIAEHHVLLTGIGFASTVLFIVTLFFLPWLVAQIPSDYFSHKRREPPQWKELHPLFRYIILILKNIIGLILLMAGFAMLLLPGQGWLTILLGLMLMDYPGKFQLERKIVSQPKLLRLINWLRVKQHQPPLLFES
ncbi:PGPGW domain-containing protein [Sulfurimonas sp. HSL3-7]|uniref:PGPGW domain-containing protein n=1 Tax=Sulfonitrofixus jiaomeiensis TaxID=3131938 RepID=UPI0031F8D556